MCYLREPRSDNPLPQSELIMKLEKRKSAYMLMLNNTIDDKMESSYTGFVGGLQEAIDIASGKWNGEDIEL